MSTKPPRRVMGQGSVSQRANGLWQAQVSLDGTRSTVYARTQAECVAKLHQLQQQVAGGLPAVNQRTMTGAYLAGWLLSVSSRVKPRTMRHYAYTVGLISGEVGRVKLARLSPADVEGMTARLAASGLSPQTCAHARATLRVALRDAQRKDRVTRNVAQIALGPTVPASEPRLLSPEAAWGVIEAMADPQLRRMVIVAVHSGVRQGELLALRWENVDWQRSEVHVSKALGRVADTYQLTDVKSRKSRRALPLTPVALEALTQERDSQSQARAAAGKRWREPIPGLIFTTATGQPRNGTTITHQFADALAVANLAPMHFHHLRHGFAGLMLGAGVELATVSALLGHSSVSLAARTYAGVERSLKHDATDRLARRLAQP